LAKRNLGPFGSYSSITEAKQDAAAVIAALRPVVGRSRRPPPDQWPKTGAAARSGAWPGLTIRMLPTELLVTPSAVILAARALAADLYSAADRRISVILPSTIRGIRAIERHRRPSLVAVRDQRRDEIAIDKQVVDLCAHVRHAQAHRAEERLLAARAARGSRRGHMVDQLVAEDFVGDGQVAAAPEVFQQPTVTARLRSPRCPPLSGSTIVGISTTLIGSPSLGGRLPDDERAVAGDVRIR
jgi:hypothetical protein